MIELRGLRKEFGDRVAVESLDLAVKRGEIFGLLGHNGAGNSTTIGMMLGQVWPTRGEVHICGCDVTRDRSGALSRVGAIFEALGKPQAALAVFDRPDFRESPYIARAYALVGRRDDALRVLNALDKRGGAFDLHEVAIAYFALGDKDRGFEWLTKAFDQRAGYVPWANVHWIFDGIRSDPRFKALVARLRLPD